MPAKSSQTVCSLPGCDRKFYGRGLCNAHYQRWRRLGTAEGLPLQESQKGRTCTVEGCERAAASRGWCQMHYYRWRKTADPLGVRKRAARRDSIEVGSKRFLRNGSGYASVYQPASGMADSRGWVPEHRWVMGQRIGRDLYADEMVHHRNGVRDDNRLENLELCVRRQPPGQRVVDLLPWAREIVERYEGMLFVL